MKIVDAYGNKHLGYPKINLAHVAEFRPVKGDTGEDTYQCIGPDGEEMGKVDGDDLKAEPSGIIPDRSGAVLVGFWLNPDSTVETFRYPILAWCIEGKSAEPVIYELLPSQWCLEVQVPREERLQWIFPEDQACDSLEEAKAHAGECLIRAREYAKKKAAERDNAKASQLVR